MVAGAVQLTGYILGVLSWVGVIGTCASPEWRKNSFGRTLMDNTQNYDGLWLRCKAYPAGDTQCVKYKAFFVGLSKTLQICRALMIASLCLGFVAVIVTSCGLKCVTLGSAHKQAKAKVAAIGGLMFGISAVFTGAAVSYFAHGVVQEYYNPSLKDGIRLYLRYEYGYSLFIGWATLVVGIVCSILVVGASVVIHMRPHVHTSQTNGTSPVGPISILTKPTAVPMHTLYRTSAAMLADPPPSHHRQVRINNAPSSVTSSNNHRGIPRKSISPRLDQRSGFSTTSSGDSRVAAPRPPQRGRIASLSQSSRERESARSIDIPMREYV